MLKSACFWSQQAIELFLKAFLLEKNVFDIRRHRTHNLIYLVRECYKIDKDFEEILEVGDLKGISSFAIITKYDISFLKMVTEQDAREAIDVAEKVRNFILRKLNIKNL